MLTEKNIFLIEYISENYSESDLFFDFSGKNYRWGGAICINFVGKGHLEPPLFFELTKMFSIVENSTQF